MNHERVITDEMIRAAMPTAVRGGVGGEGLYFDPKVGYAPSNSNIQKVVQNTDTQLLIDCTVLSFG